MTISRLGGGWNVHIDFLKSLSMPIFFFIIIIFDVELVPIFIQF